MASHVAPIVCPMCGHELTSKLAACPQCGEPLGSPFPSEDPLWSITAIKLLAAGTRFAVGAVVIAVPLGLVHRSLVVLVLGGMLPIAGILMLAGKVRCTLFANDIASTLLAIGSMIGDGMTLLIVTTTDTSAANNAWFGSLVGSWLLQVALLRRLARVVNSMEAIERCRTGVIATWLMLLVLVAVKLLLHS